MAQERGMRRGDLDRCRMPAGGACAEAVLLTPQAVRQGRMGMLPRGSRIAMPDARRADVDVGCAVGLWRLGRGSTAALEHSQPRAPGFAPPSRVLLLLQPPLPSPLV
jgi:hypothetical protein